MSNINDWQLLLTFLSVAVAQSAAILLLLVIHVIAWLVRRNPFAYWILGGLSLVLISATCVLAGVLFGSWIDWDGEPPPPDFVDRTWLIAAGSISGFLIFATCITLLHNKQFGLSPGAGFLGFYFDIAATIITPLLTVVLLVNSYWRSLPWLHTNVELSNVKDAFWITYAVIWLLLTFFRPTVLYFWKSFRHQFVSWKNPTSAD